MQLVGVTFLKRAKRDSASLPRLFAYPLLF